MIFNTSIHHIIVKMWLFVSLHYSLLLASFASIKIQLWSLVYYTQFPRFHPLQFSRYSPPVLSLAFVSGAIINPYLSSLLFLFLLWFTKSSYFVLRQGKKQVLGVYKRQITSLLLLHFNVSISVILIIVILNILLVCEGLIIVDQMLCKFYWWCSLIK